MKVFISWSGESSRAVAKELAQWLPDVLQAVEPWISSEDIPKGAQWLNEITTQLEDNSRGIVVVTPDNHERPWLNFEAGALSGKTTQARVCTALFRVTNANISGPLGAFQSTDLDSAEDIGRLVGTLNSELGPQALDAARLERALARGIPDLLERLAQISVDTSEFGPAPADPVRSDREILEELLELARGESRKDVVRDQEPSFGVLPSGEHFYIGTPVTHDTLGRGRIRRIIHLGESMVLAVQFESGGEQRLLLDHAPMTIHHDEAPF